MSLIICIQLALRKLNVIKPQLIRYLLVGITAYVCEMVTLFGLHDGAGLSPVRSVAISFWVGLVIAFILQKLVAFQNYDRRSHILATQVLVYGLLVGWNYAFTLLAVKLLEGSLSVFVIRTLVIVVVTGWNFAIYSHLFKTRQAP